MSVEFVRPTGTPSGHGAFEPASKGGTASGGFTKLVDNLLNDANTQQVQADSAVKGLALGQTDNLHNVMLSVAQADLTFRMILEIRNRLNDAYQEVMRMQV
jgi:flagellar hook-basal body complex protein FliE